MPKIQKKNLAKLTRLLAAMDTDSLTRKEFTENFAKVLKAFNKLKAKLISQLTEDFDNKTKTEIDNLAKLQKEFLQVIQKARKDSDSTFIGLKRKTFEMINSLFTKSQINEKLLEIDEKLAEVRDGRDADPVDEDKIALTASQIALKQLEDQKVNITPLKKKLNALSKELKKLKKRKPKVQYVSGGTGQGGKIVKYHDLSTSLDGGTTRTFSMPSFWRIISVHLSSFPNILRPTTDWTSDSSAMTLTITAEIPNNSLSAGQTLIVVYSES